MKIAWHIEQSAIYKDKLSEVDKVLNSHFL